MKEIKLEDLKKALEKSWSKETSADPKNWTPENPAWGQCAITALVIQDYFGGKLLRAAIDKLGSHYWNQLPDGSEIDLTKSQFPKDIIISTGEIRDRKYVLSYPDTRKRYTLLRLAVENQINSNPLFSDKLYRMCFKIAQTSECQKMKFACLIVYKGKVIVKTSNKIIEPLRRLCEPECIRFKIQSRTESMIGACGHAEEWAIREIVKLGIPLKDCSLYIAGFNAKTNEPWIKKTKDHTCLRCAVQMYMAGIKKIYVPVIDRWESITPEEAVKASAAYTLKEKSIDKGAK